MCCVPRAALARAYRAPLVGAGSDRHLATRDGVPGRRATVERRVAFRYGCGEVAPFDRSGLPALGRGRPQCGIRAGPRPQGLAPARAFEHAAVVVLLRRVARGAKVERFALAGVDVRRLPDPAGEAVFCALEARGRHW